MSLTQADLRGDRARRAWFFYMRTAMPVRLWSGFGDFRLPADNVDTDGGLYKNLGAVVKVPALKIPLNGAMIRHEFVLSMVPAEIARLANADRASVRSAVVNFGLMPLDERLQPAKPVNWLWEGTADTPRAIRQASPTAVTWTVTLSVGTGEIGRKQRRNRRWTGIEQRAQAGSSDDAFCDRTALYDAQTTERWPR